MRRCLRSGFRSLLLLGLLLASVGAAWARGTGGGVGVGIHILYSAAHANDGQVDSGRNGPSKGTLSATLHTSGQQLTFSVVTAPTNGTVAITDASTGTFVYTPAHNFIQGVDSFTFHAVDSHGATSNVATEYVVLKDPPKTQAGSAATTVDTAVTGTLAVIPAYSGEPVTFQIVRKPSKGVLVFTNPATGAFRYTPDPGFTGQDSFKYQVADSFGMPSNPSDEKIQVNDVVATVSAGSVSTAANHPVSGVLSARSTYPEQKLTFLIVTEPGHGKVTLTNPVTGAFSYMPTAGYRGSDSFTFVVKDQADTSSATATESTTVN